MSTMCMCNVRYSCSLEEMEHLRDSLRLKEASEESLSQMEAELDQAKTSLAAAANREREAEDRANRAEQQIKEMREQLEEEAAKMRNRPASPAAANSTFSDELVQLQLEQVLLNVLTKVGSVLNAVKCCRSSGKRTNCILEANWRRRSKIC